MWDSSSIFTQSSPITSEVNLQETIEEVSNLPSASENYSSSPTIVSTSGEIEECYGTTSAASPQVLTRNTSLEMNSSIQPPRPRCRLRGSNGDHRFSPYRLPNLRINANLEHCSLQNAEANIVINNESNVVSPLRATTKTSSREQSIQNQQEMESSSFLSENNRLHISADIEVNLVSSVADHDSDSMDAFRSRLQLQPSLIQPSSPILQARSGHRNSNLSNQIFLRPVSTSLFGSIYRSNNAVSKGLFKSHRKLILNRSLRTSNMLARQYSLCSEDRAMMPRVSDYLPPPSVYAQKLANHLIRMARYLKAPNLGELCCLDCGYMPVAPVTGQCGHTRCMSCIETIGTCSCGVKAPETLCVNTVVREIIEKMKKIIRKPRIREYESLPIASEEESSSSNEARDWQPSRRELVESSRDVSVFSYYYSRPRVPLTVQGRYRVACELLGAARFLEASPHLARVAASGKPHSRVARFVLAQTVTALVGAVSEARRGVVCRGLRRSLREQAARSWVRAADLECVLCTGALAEPVATPCGHTYCRACLERALLYRRTCALCLRSLESFRPADTRNTDFLVSILSCIDVAPSPEVTAFMPIVTCYVAFPGIPCPLFILDPHYWMMVRRLLQSGSRIFGMLGYEKGHTFCDYGTVLEICDCVVLEDNRCILSTVGVSRFRVVERRTKDGVEEARVQPLTDAPPTREAVRQLERLARRVPKRARAWLKGMERPVRDEIDTAFGELRERDAPQRWWRTPDGPRWLWWLIAILPLKSDIKILILSTRSLLKRMLAVSRTLDLMHGDVEEEQGHADGARGADVGYDGYDEDDDEDVDDGDDEYDGDDDNDNNDNNQHEDDDDDDDNDGGEVRGGNS